jgi:hypothetical protein
MFRSSLTSGGARHSVAECPRCVGTYQQHSAECSHLVDSMEPSGPDVDYSALRQQYADQKQEEQQQEEGDFVQVTLHLPEGDVRQLKVRLLVCCS